MRFLSCMGLLCLFALQSYAGCIEGVSIIQGRVVCLAQEVIQNGLLHPMIDWVSHDWINQQVDVPATISETAQREVSPWLNDCTSDGRECNNWFLPPEGISHQWGVDVFWEDDHIKVVILNDGQVRDTALVWIWLMDWEGNRCYYALEPASSVLMVYPQFRRTLRLYETSNYRYIEVFIASADFNTGTALGYGYRGAYSPQTSGIVETTFGSIKQCYGGPS